MKQFIAIVAIVALASCGGSSTTEAPKTDSTTVKKDSVKVESPKKDGDTTKKIK